MATDAISGALINSDVLGWVDVATYIRQVRPSKNVAALISTRANPTAGVAGQTSKAGPADYSEQVTIPANTYMLRALLAMASCGDEVPHSLALGQPGSGWNLTGGTIIITDVNINCPSDQLMEVTSTWRYNVPPTPGVF